MTPLSTTAVRDAVADLEERFPVDAWTLDGVRVWPLYRIDLYFALFYAGRRAPPPLGRSRLRETASTLRRHAKQLWAHRRAVVADRRANARVERDTGCVFLTYTAHRTRFGDTFYDKFCDPYVDGLGSLGVSSLLLEISQDGAYRLPRHGHSKLIQPAVLAAELAAHAGMHKPREALDGFDAMLAHLRATFPDVVTPTREALVGKWRFVHALRRRFARILDATRPHVVFIADYYSLHAAALLLAARERGVTTVDIQHGLQGDEHLAYGSWRRVPEGGWELLPSVFWVWSDDEAATIEKWNGPVRAHHDVFVGGSLWAALWSGDADPKVRAYDERLREIAARIGAAGRTNVLFTPSLAGDAKPWLFDAMASASDVFWWIRLHPSRRDEFGAIGEEVRARALTNVNVEEATTLPLPALLRHVDANVTAFSSTVVDAAQAGVRSVLVDPGGVGQYPRQLAAGVATAAFDADALLATVRALAENRPSAAVAGGDGAGEPAEARVRRFLMRYAPELLRPR